MLTCIGALAYGAEILPPSVDKPGKWVHVRLAAIASDWSTGSMVNEM